ncbi:hypothetical protein AG0111_0g9423 [Alternaria gaisen]|uniref:Uncharacterized protein n=1 Tax=Alternaria gaisen TaxID=167740 RepID=A0ACB6FD04_9PLEO|nr:hypothetical protein AG0111_0g9423 [Alternaria gaisen]
MLSLPLPPTKASSSTLILIYSASTATETLAVQFARLSGAKVFATASLANFDFVKELGADHVFDYKDPYYGGKICKASNDESKPVFDCMAGHGKEKICATAISSQGGQYSGLSVEALNDLPRQAVKYGWNFGYTGLGREG